VLLSARQLDHIHLNAKYFESDLLFEKELILL